MNNQRSGLISKGLIALGLLLFIVSTFCFFGAGVHIPNRPADPSMIDFMFNIGNADGYHIGGLTTIFVFQMINVAFIVIAIGGLFTKRISSLLAAIMIGVVCLFAFISFIISFNTLNLYYAAGASKMPEIVLGAGSISYSVLNIIGLLACGSGFFLSRKGL